MTRGFYFATVEQAEDWTSERVRPLVLQLLEILSATPAKKRILRLGRRRCQRRRHARAPRS